MHHKIITISKTRCRHTKTLYTTPNEMRKFREEEEKPTGRQTKEQRPPTRDLTKQEEESSERRQKRTI